MEQMVDLDALWKDCRKESIRIFSEHYDDLHNSFNVKDQETIETMLNGKGFQDDLERMKGIVQSRPQAAQGYKDMEKLRSMYKTILYRKPWEKAEDEVFTLLYEMAKGYIPSNPLPRYSPANQMWIYSVLLHENFAHHLARRYTQMVYDGLTATGETDMILPVLRDQLSKYLKGTATHLLESLSHKDRLIGKRIYTMMRQENIGYGASFLPYNEKITQ